MYRLRFLLTMIGCLFKKPRGLLEQYDLKFRAWPLIDTDVNRLFTQTYSVYMGLARWHYVFSSQFKNVAVKKRWVPVTTAETTRYLRSIKAFEKVTVRTQLVCWSEKRFFLKHTFLVKKEVRASTLVEGLLRSPSATLNPIDVFKILGLNESSPSMPDEIKHWSLARF